MNATATPSAATPAGTPAESPDFYDAGAEADMLAHERAILEQTRERPSGAGWTGIGCSGGGIRAATFCLGATQALADKNLLAHFDYMSTVSGSGYLGSALQWWWHGAEGRTDTDVPFDASKDQFPYGTSLPLNSGEPGSQERILDFLRQHGKYLTPGDGMTLWSSAAVVLRTLFLNLAVWIPLGALVFIVMIGLSREAIFQVPALLPWITNPLSVLIVGDWYATTQKCGDHGCYLRFGVLFGLSAWLSFGLLIFYACYAVTLAFLSFASRPDWLGSGASLRARTVAGVMVFALLCVLLLFFMAPSLRSLNSWEWRPLATLFGAVAGIVLSVALAVLTAAHSNYFWRRRFEVNAGAGLTIATLSLAVGSVPLIPYYIANYGGQITGSLSAVAGAVGGLISAGYGHFTQSRGKNVAGSAGVIASISSGIFIYFVMIIAYVVAQLFWNTSEVVTLSPEAPRELQGAAYRVVQGAIAFSIVLAAFLGLLTNINYVGLHRFYRDRIMEAFMPSLATVEARNHRVVPSKKADNLQISDLWPNTPGVRRQTPYPLINTSVVLVNDRNPKLALRGGDSFLVSPLFVGSTATGWQETGSFIRQNGALTLASAMAASGAAVNANAAYVGSGTTRERLLSIVMMLLNLRLGLWTAAPSKKHHSYRLFTPNHFHPGLTFGLFRWGHKATSSFVELTDGGHFDNIGLYELVRRRCKLILISDSEQDAESSMPALVSAVQSIQEYFGAAVDMTPSIVDGIVPAPGAGFPIGAHYVRTPFFETTIRYRPQDGETESIGQLIYVKSALIEDLDFAAKGYWAQNPTFPHQSTADQFFDPIQFEAYRQVGYRCMAMAIAGTSLQKLGAQLDREANGTTNSTTPK